MPRLTKTTQAKPATSTKRKKATMTANPRWTPDMVTRYQDAAKADTTVAERQSNLDLDLSPLFTNAMPETTETVEPVQQADDTSHGPDAAQAGGVEDEELIAARLWLNEMIANPPAGSVQVDVTPALARAGLERNLDNRAIGPVKLRTYQDAMERGEWKANGQPIIFGLNGKLLNGQHRFLATSRSGRTVPMDLRFGIDNEAFKTMDTGKPRTIVDVFRIMGIANAKTLAGAARLLLRYQYSNRMAKVAFTEAQIEKAVISTPLLAEGASLASNFCKNSGLASPTAFAFLWTVCHEVDEEAADRFFELLEKRGLGITNENNPVWRFSVLVNSVNSKGMTAEELSAIGIKAFNAFRLNRDLKLLRWTGSSSGKAQQEPFPVAGDTKFYRRNSSGKAE